MNEKELKAYQDKLMSGTKGTMKLGVMTGVGGAMIGQMGNLGPATAPVSGGAIILFVGYVIIAAVAGGLI